MRFPRALTTTLAAAALAVGLVAAAPAAQAAPPSLAPSATAQQVQGTAPAEKAAKARTRIKVTAPRTIKAGQDIAITAKLTRKTGRTYKPYAKKKLLLVLLPSPGAQSGGVIMTRKTGTKGKARFVLDTADPAVAGKTFDFLVAYEGGSKARRAESDVFSVSVTK